MKNPKISLGNHSKFFQESSQNLPWESSQTLPGISPELSPGNHSKISQEPSQIFPGILLSSPLGIISKALRNPPKIFRESSQNLPQIIAKFSGNHPQTVPWESSQTFPMNHLSHYPKLSWNSSPNLPGITKLPEPLSRTSPGIT